MRNNEGERKRERENSLNLSLSKDNTAIFKEVIEPQVVLVFYNCLQNLNKISEISSSMKKAQIKSIRHMEEVNKSINFINEKFEEMKQIERRKKKNFRTKKVRNLNEKVETMDRSLNFQEQYSRRTCILLRGVKGYEKESTDQIKY